MTQQQHFQLTHNWQHETAHIMRKHGFIRRCKMEGMDLHQGEVSIMVVFNERSATTNKIITKKKAVSPLVLAFANAIWRLQAAVSSDDEDDESNPNPIAPPVVPKLPPLVCTNSYLLNAMEQRKLKWMLDQVNAMLAFDCNIPFCHKVKKTE